MHNGLPIDLGLLNEKWEALALLPVNKPRNGRDVKDEYFLLVVSDNDFITDHGEYAVKICVVCIDMGKVADTCV